MSRFFFGQLGILEPDVNSGTGASSHRGQPGKMLIAVEEVLLKKRPHVVAVYGDTSSTPRDALCASRLHIPQAHVEAEGRSLNREMPEEVDKIVADHLSDTPLFPNVTTVVETGLAEFVTITGLLWSHLSLMRRMDSEALERREVSRWSLALVASVVGLVISGLTMDVFWRKCFWWTLILCWASSGRGQASRA